jgi:F-type H+-transporting ATPase subunit epsilon
MITTLGFGLARFRLGDSPWQYVAVPGAVLYFVRDELFLSTRHYLRGSDYGWISAALQEKLAAEEETLRGVKESLRRLEEELLRRMWQIGREAARR